MDWQGIIPIMGLFSNYWSNTLKLFNMSKMTNTPHMRAPRTIPPTTRVSKYSSNYSTTYQGTSMGSTSIYIPVSIWTKIGPYITMVQDSRHHRQGFQGLFQRYHIIFKQYTFHGIQAHHIRLHIQVMRESWPKIPSYQRLQQSWAYKPPYVWIPRLK